ncbi:serine/threonine-protein kinase ULK2-like isoform X2 [Lineus longissimus]|uniref:serine/threonine-protein kinase ULK2-like isoform X2 n=1 Tax=Lineus longissimus TaxID=88925 RepID=UPI002B4D9752
METIGEYEYSKKDLIGHGAFAVVFKGRLKKSHESVVAIKSITKKNLAKSQNLLSKEIKILKELSDLHHENVVALLDCKETTHHVYLVMEYCNGGDLADYLQAKGTLSEDTITSFLKQIAGAMRALNAKGIVHRDLKPQNLLLCHAGKPSPQPSDIRIKIADFGFARFLQDGVMAATLCGSPMYMAPEVIMSLQYDAKADLWSIGTIVFQCLTGKAPFQAQTPQQLKQFYEKHANLAPNIPPGTSPELKDLLLKMLKRNARDRIEFEDFFMHPFLTQGREKKSAPMAVPRRRASSSSASDSPSVKTVSASPLSGFMPATPPDFVMVPEHLSGENSDENATSHRSRASNEYGHPTSLNADQCQRNNNGNFQEMSPNRPSTLPVPSPTSSPASQAIPVPTQVKAYEQLQKNSPTSPYRCDQSSPHLMPRSQGMAIPNKRNSVGSSGPDIGSLSPPSVQFMIGTPPSTTWKRSSVSGGTPPPTRNASNTPPNNNESTNRFAGISPPPYGGNLPTIHGSPTKKFMINIGGYPSHSSHHDPNSPSLPLNPPFGTTKHKTCPDMASLWEEEENQVAPYYLHRDRAVTNPDFATSPNSGRAILGDREQLLRAAFGGGGVATSPPNSGFYGGMATSPMYEQQHGMPFSVTSPKHGKENMNMNRQVGRRRSLSAIEPSSPHRNYARSPPNMEGPVIFVAPELAEETLMDREHNETISKLNFVVALVECIIELAQTRSTPLNDSIISPNKQNDTFTLDHISFISEGQRRLEQLVLYVRALQMLSSSIQLAQNEIRMRRLQPSSAVKQVLKEMNSLYHQCLSVCKHLHRKGIPPVSGLNPETTTITAEKLIYSYAIEMCQTAALDELFGNPRECFRRYQNAQILLHSLAQQAQTKKDRVLLEKYKESVEQRLFNLQGQGVVYMYEAS